MKPTDLNDLPLTRPVELAREGYAAWIATTPRPDDDTHPHHSEEQPVIWTLNIQCPRPPNRTVDEFHTRPDRLARRVDTLLGPDATVTLTPRRVRLVVTGADALPDIGQWQAQLALLLYSVHLGRSSTDLPTPVRTEIRQDHPTAHHPAKGPS